MTMGKSWVDAREGNHEYLDDVDDAEDTTCWSTKRQRKLKIQYFGKFVGYPKVDCIKYNQDQFDCRPITPNFPSNKKFKLNYWKKLECSKRFKKSFSLDNDKRYDAL